MLETALNIYIYIYNKNNIAHKRTSERIHEPQVEK